MGIVERRRDFILPASTPQLSAPRQPMFSLPNSLCIVSQRVG